MPYRFLIPFYTVFWIISLWFFVNIFSHILLFKSFNMSLVRRKIWKFIKICIFYFFSQLNLHEFKLPLKVDVNCVKILILWLLFIIHLSQFLVAVFFGVSELWFQKLNSVIEFWQLEFAFGHLLLARCQLLIDRIQLFRVVRLQLLNPFLIWSSLLGKLVIVFFSHLIKFLIKFISLYFLSMIKFLGLFFQIVKLVIKFSVLFFQFKIL